MKKVLVIFAALAIAVSLVGCKSSGLDVSKLKPIETHKVGDINVVLMNDTGELKQGQNDFVVQFQSLLRNGKCKFMRLQDKRVAIGHGDGSQGDDGSVDEPGYACAHRHFRHGRLGLRSNQAWQCL